MNEIKELVKHDKSVLKATHEQLSSLNEINFKTLQVLYAQSTSENQIMKKMIEYAGEEMLEYERKQDEDADIIEQYQKYVGDDKIHQKFIDATKLKFNEKIWENNDDHKKRIIRKMSRRIEEVQK